jgi:hypothetical protein
VTEGVSASTYVSARELARITQQGSLMDALQRLRPGILASRGATPTVSIDGAPLAELAILRSISVGMVRHVRLQRGSSGTARASVAVNGKTVVGDVIVVTTWEGSRRH